MFFNSRSLCNKICDLHYLLDTQSNNSHKYDCIFVCETWLDDTINNGILLCNNKDYVLLRNDRLTRGGGVCAFVNSHLNFVPVLIAQNFAQCEVLCIDILYKKWKHRFITAYRPPLSDLFSTDLLINCLESLCDVSYSITICGDFNFPLINWSDNFDLSSLRPLEARLASFIIDRGMIQLIHEPTRLTNILDLLIVSDPFNAFDVSVTCPFSTSDHNCITWSSWCPSSLKGSDIPIFRYNFRRCDFSAMSSFLNQINWVQLFSTIAPNDVDGLWLKFKRVIYQAIDQFTLICSSNRSSYCVNKYPSYIRRALRRKLTLWHCRHAGPKSLAIYKAQACKCKKIIRRFHRLREQRLLSKNSVSAFYRYVNGKLHSGRRIAPLKTIKGSVLTEDADKAHAFNEYFSSVFNNSVLSHNSFPTSHHKIVSTSVIFSIKTVYKALRGAKKSLSAGPDQLPSLLWSNIAASVAFPVSVLFTSSYIYARVPREWKCAIIRPLFKKGDPSLVSNYRPISQTCTLCKLMESIVKENLLDFALSNNIISSNQHGFLPKRSTCAQMLECNYDWRCAIDVGDVVDVVLIDFSKAFDVVPHVLLLDKLALLGICTQTLRWLESFLSDRSQVVDVNGKSSTSKTVSSGVIQGSVIGPILFTFYVNDLPSACSDCQIEMFADDAKAYKVIRQPQHRVYLQSALNALCKWSKKWLLQLSVDKCIYLQLGYFDEAFSYSLDGHILKPQKQARDLGVTLQYNLKPGLHCTDIAHKASIRANLIIKSFLSHDPFTIVRAFTVYVRPLLEYSTPVWSPFNKADINIIENVQRAFTRRVFSLCQLPKSSYENRLLYLGLQRLELRRILYDLTFLYKIIHGMVHCNLLNIIKLASDVRPDINTRGHKFKLFVPRTHKQVFSSYFINRIIPIWNFLPTSCFNVNHLSAFKRACRSVDFSRFLKGRL